MYARIIEDKVRTAEIEVMPQNFRVLIRAQLGLMNLE